MTKASMTRAAFQFNTAKFPKRSEKVTRMVSPRALQNGIEVGPLRSPGAAPLHWMEFSERTSQR
jgi:hypothetical protein